MLQIDRKNQVLTAIKPTTLTAEGIKERYDLQALIWRYPEAFCAELGEHLLLIDHEVPLGDAAERRIDLLAIDRQGTVVIIELKRGNDHLQLLQALSYAAMIDDWAPERLIDRRSRAMNVSVAEAQDEVERFLDCELAALNESQRVFLLAEAFDYEVLATSQWLIDRYDLDVQCFQMNLAEHDGLTLLSCTRLLPVQDLRDQALRRRRSAAGKTPRWSDWETALASMTHEHQRAFYRRQLERGCDHYLADAVLYFRHENKRRWVVQPRALHCYVWQAGRFENDLAFWCERLSEAAQVGAVDQGRALRFYLTSADDFERFERAVEEPDAIRFLSPGQVAESQEPIDADETDDADSSDPSDEGQS